MDLKSYFSDTTGTGVLSTVNGGGEVGSAIYSRPRVTEEDRVAFIMRERRMYNNLQSNSYASFVFIENIAPYSGIRLDLEKVEESDDEELISQMTRRTLTKEEDRAKGPKHIVYFKVNKTLPLVGAG